MKKNFAWAMVMVASLLFISCENDDTEAPTLFMVTITSSEGGTTNASTGEYASGTLLNLTATPNQGYVFENWSGDVSGTTASIAVTVENDLNIIANFALDEIAEEPDEKIAFINEGLIDTSGYIFAIENGGKTCFLMDHFGTVVHEWQFELSLGQDAELTPEGNLIGLFKGDNSPVNFGGQSGILREIDPQGNVVWEYTIITEDEIAHHDFTQMPNGNLLVLVWYRIANEEAVAVGLNNTDDVFVEKVIELNPDTNAVVWEWKSWDHIVQDHNNTLASFGDPELEKEKINILYANNGVHQFVELGDLIHFNGIAYYPEKDIIALSANFYSEVWLIDHSTTTSEAATATGGQFNKGGRLLYRFGNQKVYGDNNASSTLNFNHHPSFIENDNALSLLIYNNNNAVEQSRAMEFLLPELTSTTAIGAEPSLLFDFTDEDLYFGRVSGAVRLPNGNTLICEGDYGYWEVTASGELAWKYNGQGQNFWRGLYYTTESETIQNLAARSDSF